MKCKKCGFDNEENNVHCSNCGTLLEKEVQKKEINDIKTPFQKACRYSQFLIPASILISIIFIIIELKISIAASTDDSLGYAMLIFGPFLLIFHMYYFAGILALSLIKIDKWLSNEPKNKNNSARIIALIIFYILSLLPALNRIPSIIHGIFFK